MENYKLKENKNLKVYIKIEKRIIKFGDIELGKQKFYHHKITISINNVDIKVSFKKDFNILLVTRTLKKEDFYVYIFFKNECM